MTSWRTVPVRGTCAVLLVYTAACSGCAREPMDAPTMEDETRVVVQRQCLGRFCLDVPAASRRAGAEYGLRWLAVREQVFPGAGARASQESASAAWDQQVENAVALEAEERLEPGDVRGRQRANEELEPGLRFLSYYTTLEPIGARVVALKTQGAVGLWMEQTLDVEFEPRARAEMLQLARGYQVRPEAATWPQRGQDWFYLDHGAVQLPFHDQEKSSVVFDGGPLDGTLEVETESVREVKKKGLVERFMDSVGVAGAYAEGVSRVRSRSRKVAGFTGEELVLRSAEQGEVAYLWTFHGEANSGAAPLIRIAWQTGDGDPRAKSALWDQLLDSLRPAKSP